MAIKPGEYEIGPQVGRLALRTYRQGMASRAGHDLLIEASVWEGQVAMPGKSAAEARVSVSVDLGALTVVEGSGGVKPLGDGDKRQIKKTMNKLLQVGSYPHATFTSTAVDVHGHSGTIEGDLALAGQTHPLRLEVEQQNSAVEGSASVVQSRWGIKPYTGFLGALKLRDEVDVEFTVALPGD